MTTATLSGKTVGHFVIEEEIGRGGMGLVYRGWQPNLERPVVLKKLRRDLSDLPEIVERFQREARAASTVHHQNVVSVYDCFSWRAEHYIAQEFVDGVDLRAVIAHARRIPPEVAARIALEALRGLESIHARGIVHRDLKPANLLLGRAGEVKIADFGIALEPQGAALTQPGTLIGTPPYMPPEQLLGERVDPRGDLFSLGVIVYEMLSGAPPFALPGPEVSETLLERMQQERYPSLKRSAPDAPRSLVRLVRGCLRGRPRQRIQEAARARRDLERRLAGAFPEDCRARIAGWLWEQGVFEERAGETRLLAAETPAPRSALRWAGAALLALGIGSTLAVVNVDSLAPSSAPARVRVVAGESVEIRVDGGPPLPVDTEPLLLEPGPHRIELIDPDQGRRVEELVLEPGEELVLRSPFAPPSAP